MSGRTSVCLQAQRQQEITITLRPKPAGGSVAGTVTDGDGKPVAGAQVLYSGDGPRTKKSTRTGATGAFVLDGIEALGRFPTDIIVRAKGWAPVAVPLTQLGTRQAPAKLDVQLTEQGHRISGRVVDEDGKPIDKVRVRAGAVDRTVADERTDMTITNGDGRFKFDSLPSPASFDFRVRGYSDIDFKELPLDGAGDETVVMRHMAAIAGKVVDSDTGQPVTRFNIKILHHIDTGEEFSGGGGDFHLEDVDPGNAVTLVVSAEGYPVQYFDDVTPTPAGQGQPTVIKLSKHPADYIRIAGRIVDAGGNPIEGVEVRAISYMADDQNFPAEMRFSWQMLRSGQLDYQNYIRAIEQTRTDASGAFAFPSLRGPGIDIVYWGKGVPQARLEDVGSEAANQREHLDLRVSPPATITGRINRQVYANPANLTLTSTTDAKFELRIQTKAEDEHYTFADVPAGSYEIVISGQAVSEGNGTFSFPEIGRIPVEVKAGESKQFDLGFKVSVAPATQPSP